MFDNPAYLKPKHPKSTSALIMSITALVLIFLNACCGFLVFVSLTLGIMAIVMAKRIKEEVMANPAEYHPDSLKEAETAKVIGIIATILSGIMLVIGIILVFIYGIAILFSLFEGMR